MNLLFNALTNDVIHGQDKGLSGTTIASVVITGMVVVFIGLILLVLFVALYGKIFHGISKKKELESQNDSNGNEDYIEQSDNENQSFIVDDDIEEEVVAVIMGAISAMSSNSDKKLILKSIKNAKPQRNAWASAGIAENTKPF